LFLEAIDRRKIVGDWNYNRGNELNCDREDEKSRLLERLRNLGITPSDDGCMDLTTKEDEELQ
jgi:hypothetical protein